MVEASSSEIPLHLAVEVPDGDGALDHEGAVRLRAHARDRPVGLIRDVPDDFLQNVLQRNDASEGAMFVDHQREVLRRSRNA